MSSPEQPKQNASEQLKSPEKKTDVDIDNLINSDPNKIIEARNLPPDSRQKIVDLQIKFKKELDNIKEPYEAAKNAVKAQATEEFLHIIGQ